MASNGSRLLLLISIIIIDDTSSSPSSTKSAPTTGSIKGHKATFPVSGFWFLVSEREHWQSSGLTRLLAGFSVQGNKVAQWFHQFSASALVGLTLSRSRGVATFKGQGKSLFWNSIVLGCGNVAVP
ncbi:hypothetical protein MRB53_039828 [Persea americana]|nr:hypothetical protein MRB53_039828 [Persea americana]